LKGQKDGGNVLPMFLKKKKEKCSGNVQTKGIPSGGKKETVRGWGGYAPRPRACKGAEREKKTRPGVMEHFEKKD